MAGHRHDGLAYELTPPDGEPRGGVVVLHGAGSRKENHRDFAARCAAAGIAAVVFDQRGHGASEGALDGRALDDVAAIASLLPGDVPLFLRGSSMGGFVALAAAAPAGAASVPLAHSRRLHEAAPGSRLLAVPGGDHQSAQHDPVLQAAAVAFLVGLTPASDTF